MKETIPALVLHPHHASMLIAILTKLMLRIRLVNSIQLNKIIALCSFIQNCLTSMGKRVQMKNQILKPKAIYFIQKGYTVGCLSQEYGIKGVMIVCR